MLVLAHREETSCGYQWTVDEVDFVKGAISKILASTVSIGGHPIDQVTEAVLRIVS